MFTDEPRRIVCERLRQQDLRAFSKLLTPEVLAQAALRAGVAMGGGPLCLANLACLAVSCALHTTRNFAGVLAMSLKLLQDADAWSRTPLARQCKARPRAKVRSKHDPRPAQDAGVSEEAFCQARNKAPASYWLSLILLLGEKFAAAHGAKLRWRGRRLLALDGTTLGLPNWKALREHYGTAGNARSTRKRRRRKTQAGRSTQARMVMLSFPLCRMPLRYELCPLSRSEKTCAASLLGGLEAGDLVLMDKGFWSYGLFRQIASQQAFFATRLFAGVTLRTLRKLGPGDRLVRYCPSDRKYKAAGRQGSALLGLPPSMELRVIRYRVPGFRPTALVTNLTDGRIRRESWVGLAGSDEAGPTLMGGLYHRRWEIETSFCELKVRQRMEGSLRGRTPRTIEYEVAGHVLLYLLTRWLMVEAAQRHRVKDPLRLSYLQALRELMDIAPALLISTPERARRVLVPRLLRRVASHVVPHRPGRHYPRPGDTKVKYVGRGHYRLPSKLKRAKAGEA
jgi:hypothetical protein